MKIDRLMGIVVYLLYCRPLEFTVISGWKNLASGLQSGVTANLIGVQYK